MFRRKGKNPKRSALDVFLVVYADQQETGKPVTPKTINHSLDKNREQAYRLLETFMLKRAYLEALTLQPTLTSESEVQGIERTLRWQIRKIEWVSLVTGLRIPLDGSPLLPVGFQLQRLYKGIIAHLHGLIAEMTEGPPKPQFPLEVRKLRSMMETLSRHFDELCRKASVIKSCDEFFNKINPKSLGALYEALRDSAAVVQDAVTLDADSRRLLLNIQADEETRFGDQLEKAVTEEALAIQQQVARASNKPTREETIRDLQPRIEELRQTLMTARLSGKLIQPAEEIISNYWQGGGS